MKSIWTYRLNNSKNWGTLDNLMRNIVLIVLDTVRKDIYDDRAQRLQSLPGTDFERAYAPSSWSIPSHASILTGQLPHRHGVHSYNPDYSDLKHTFFEDLDHQTLGISANGAVSEAFGFHTHFDEFVSFAGGDERSPDAMSFKHIGGTDGPARYLEYLKKATDRGQFTESFLNGLYVKANDLLDGRPLPNIGDGGAAAVADKSREMTADIEEPFVLFTNFIDAHSPLVNLRVLDSDVPYGWTSNRLDIDEARAANREDIEGFLENYRKLYTSNIEYLDRVVTDLIEDIQAQTARETIAIIIADHGEELRYPGERDLGHTDFTNAVLHVPLTVVGTDIPDQTLSGPVSLLDIETLATELARGEDLPDIIREHVPAERIGMLFYGGDNEYWRRGVRTVYEDEVRHEWDTQETQNRIEVSVSEDGERTPTDPPEWGLSLFEKDLDEYVASAKAAGNGPDIDTQTEEQLADLGYKV